MEETPSQEQELRTATEDDQEIPLQMFDGLREDMTDEEY